jgi:hypothetical protein
VLHIDAETLQVVRLRDVRLAHIIDKRGNQENVVVSDDVRVGDRTNWKLTELVHCLCRFSGTIEAHGKIKFIPERLVA